MSNYYDTLGQDLAPAMGMPPIDQYGQPHPDPLPPPMPPPMPPNSPSMGGGAVGGGGGGGGMSDGVSPVLAPGPNVTQPGPPPGIPMPPPMGGGGPGFQGDPFNQALTQAGAATQMFSPGAPGLAPRPPMPPPMVPPQQGGGGQQQVQSGPPMPPPQPGMTAAGAGGSGVPFGPSTDYKTAMGIAPTDQNRGQSMLAGLGKGLSAAASSKNSAGNAFMKGAGGSITGGIQEQQEQEKLAQGLQNQYMNQASAAFKDLQTKRSTDSLEIYRQAVAAKNDALVANGGPASKAFLNTPEGKLHLAQTEASQQYNSDRQDIIDQQKLGLDSTVAQKQLAALQAKKGGYLSDAYKKYGVDPDFAANAATRGLDLPKKFSDIKPGQYYVAPDGTTKKKTANSTDYKPDDTVNWRNPFDANKMTDAQINQTIPDGGLYEAGGTLYTKNQAPAAPGTPASPQQVQAAAAPAQPSGPPMPPPMRPDPMADPQAVYGGSPYPYGQQ